MVETPRQSVGLKKFAEDRLKASMLMMRFELGVKLLRINRSLWLAHKITDR